MGLTFTNNAEAVLASGIGASDTSLDVSPGQGTKFPVVDFAATGDFFYGTIVDQAGNREIIRVKEHVAGTIDTFSIIERAVDSISGAATAYAFVAGDRVQIRVPAIAILSPDSTKSDKFTLGADTSGPTLKNSSGVLEIKNLSDTAYANLKALGLTLTDALVIAGSITGVTTLTTSGAITAGGTSDIPIDNVASAKKILARDHGAPDEPEVTNVIYGTGSPPVASSTPEGTLWFKYIA